MALVTTSMAILSLTGMAKAFADATGKPTMIVRTEGMGASSMRYADVALPEAARDTLREDGIAFVAFEDGGRAEAAFDRIDDQFPPSGDTPLSIEVVLCMPSSELVVRMPSGVTRTFQEVNRAAFRTKTLRQDAGGQRTVRFDCDEGCRGDGVDGEESA